MLESAKLAPSGDGAQEKPVPEVKVDREDEADLFSEGEDTSNPYLEDDYASDQTYLHLADSRRKWQVATAWLATFLTVFMIAFLVLAFTARFQLWVAEVDMFGNVLSLEPVDEVEEVPNNSKRRIIGEFITNARAVYSDEYARQAATDEVYHYVTSDVKEWFDSYQEQPEHDPRNLAESFSRTAILRSITRLPETENRYEVQWTETQHYGGGKSETSLWKAYITTTRTAPSTSAQAAVNPYGLLISDIDWSRITSVP